MADSQSPTSIQALDSKYELCQLLGWGAHGEVYQAVHIETKEKVAVKIFFTNHQDAARFVRKELSSISQLTHPNLLPFRDFGSCQWKGEQVEYIVTPFMEGGNLDLLIRKTGACKITYAVDIALQITQALQYMHSRNYLHRDVKPANILLDKSGNNAVLADFSISCSPDNPATGPIGTPEYSSPEQLGNPNEQHPSMDVYGLGVTLYEMLCGTNPFREIQKKQGQAAALQAKYLGLDIPLVTQYNQKIPKGLAQVIAKMLSANAQDRYENMEEVKSSLLPYTSTAQTMIEETSEEVVDVVSYVKISPPLSFKAKLKKIVKATSRYIIIIFWYGTILISLGWYRLWQRCFFSKQRITDLIQILWQQASNKKNQHHTYSAMSLYWQIQWLQPQHSRASNYLGDILVKCQCFTSALKCFDLAILSNPKYYSAYCHRGYVYGKLENFSRAQQDYDIAILLDSKKPQAYFYRAETWLRLALKSIEQQDFIVASQHYRCMQKDLEIARRFAGNASNNSDISSIH